MLEHDFLSHKPTMLLVFERGPAAQNYVTHAMCPYILKQHARAHHLQPDCGCGSLWDPNTE